MFRLENGLFDAAEIKIIKCTFRAAHEDGDIFVPAPLVRRGKYSCSLRLDMSVATRIKICMPFPHGVIQILHDHLL